MLTVEFANVFSANLLLNFFFILVKLQNKFFCQKFSKLTCSGSDFDKFSPFLSIFFQQMTDSFSIIKI
jgi:hypothetical protein